MTRGFRRFGLWWFGLVIWGLQRHHEGGRGDSFTSSLWSGRGRKRKRESGKRRREKGREKSERKSEEKEDEGSTERGGAEV